MADKMKIAVIGSTGYGGVELIRFLLHHPNVELTSVVSSSQAGTSIHEGFPHLSGIVPFVLDEVDVPLLRSKADLVFLATPAGVSSKLAPDFLKAGMKVIDLSGDFRIQSVEDYERWYKLKSPDKEWLDKAVYGLSELYREDIKGADFISNPGCYPTATLLGLIPVLRKGWIDPSSIIIDAKSGVSGAGRKVNLNTHFSETNENFRAYKVNQHQHIPEIEQELSKAAGQDIVTTFTTHLVPMTRGIMCTMYTSLSEPKTVEEMISYYQSFYRGRPFVRIREQGVWPATKEVWGSNYCDIGFAVDERTGRLTIIAVIDNIVKGAAGQAVQNLNIMMGWDEAEGLRYSPVFP